MMRRMGLARLPEMLAMRPFDRLWPALGEHFNDPRLQQLFGRYATYCGSSPFKAPATLMLIAHLEARGVWLIEGGIHALAKALAGLAIRQGAHVRTGAAVAEILTDKGRTSGVRLASGEVIAAAALVDRSAGSVDLGVPFFPLIAINFPTYAPDELPPELAATPATKPGSRAKP